MRYPSDIPICMRTRSVTDMLRHRLCRVMAGLESPAEFLALCFDRIASRFTGHSSHIRQDMHFKRIHKKLLSMGYVKEDHYDLSGIKLPIMDANTMRAFFKQSFEDDYYIYLFGNDDYEEKIILMLRSKQVI